MRSLQDRFEEKVELIPFSTCHWWTAARNNLGYGVIGVGKKLELAHRVSFKLYVGPITAPCVLHKCDNPMCVNPAHLFPGDQKDNMADSVAKGRARGPSKLTEDNVREIRLLSKSGMTGGNIANGFNVDQSTVSDILTGESWKHI